MLGVFSCRFTRRDCPHATLFHDSYQRVNRTRQNKILRCFPHCCHGHSARSYCGASLHVQVDFDARPPTASSSSDASSSAAARVRQPLADDDVLVFARFRPALQRSRVAVGARLDPQTVLASLQSDANPAGEWIEGWLRASAHQAAWLFEVNRGARWHYGWGSSAATSARTTAHVLEVVVFVVRSDGRPPELEVVATAQSPPFRVVSFRRRTVEAATETTPATGSDGVQETSASASAVSAVSALPRSPPTSALPPPHRDDDLAVVLSAASEGATRLPRWDCAFERAVVRQRAPPHHLPAPLLAPLLPCPPPSATDAAVDLAMWLATDASVRRAWRRALAHAAAHVASRPRLLNAHGDWLATLRARADVWLAAQQPLRPWPWPSVAALAHAATADRPQLPPGAAIDALAPLSFGAFVANVRQEAATQHRARFTQRRRHRHNRVHAGDGDVEMLRVPRPQPPLPGLGIVRWWFCPLERVRVWPLSASGPPQRESSAAGAVVSTLPLVAWFYRQLACVAVVMSGSQPSDATATIYSAANGGGDDADAGAGMTLRLDGRPRWTATLPNGDATLGTRAASAWVVGDYVAHPQRSGDDYSASSATTDVTTLSVDWFAWQVRPSEPSGTASVCTAARRCRVQVRESGDDDGDFLVVVATIERGVFREDADAAEDGEPTPFDEAEPPERRLWRVRAWAPCWRLELRYRRV